MNSIVRTTSAARAATAPAASLGGSLPFWSDVLRLPRTIGAGPPTRRRARRGALLLEVIIALAILVAATGLLGAQLVSGLKMTAYAEEQMRAAQLSDRITALLELDQTTVEKLLAEQNADGDFGEQYPGWFWRALVEPTDIPGLGLLRVQILRQEDTTKPRDIHGAKLRREMRLLKASPAMVNPLEFGLTEEQLGLLLNFLPADLSGGTGAVDGGTTVGSGLPTGGVGPGTPLISPQAVAKMIGEMLSSGLLSSLPPELIDSLLSGDFNGGIPPELLQMISGAGGGAIPPEMMSLLGGGGGGLGGLLGGDIGNLLGGGREGGGRGGAGGGNEAIADMLRGALGGQVSDEEIDNLIGGIGGGAGDTPGRQPRSASPGELSRGGRTPSDLGAGPRTGSGPDRAPRGGRTGRDSGESPRSIDDLDRERDDRNAGRRPGRSSRGGGRDGG